MNLLAGERRNTSRAPKLVVLAYMTHLLEKFCLVGAVGPKKQVHSPTHLFPELSGQDSMPKHTSPLI